MSLEQEPGSLGAGIFFMKNPVQKSVYDGKKGLGVEDCRLGENQGSMTVDFINNCGYIT